MESQPRGTVAGGRGGAFGASSFRLDGFQFIVLMFVNLWAGGAARFCEETILS